MNAFKTEGVLEFQQKCLILFLLTSINRKIRAWGGGGFGKVEKKFYSKFWLIW